MNKSVKVGATIVGLFTAASNLIGCASTSKISDLTPGHTEQSQSQKAFVGVWVGQETSKKVDGARTEEKSTVGILMPDVSGVVVFVNEAPGAYFSPVYPYYSGGYGYASRGPGLQHGYIQHGEVGGIHGGDRGYAHFHMR